MKYFFFLLLALLSWPALNAQIPTQTLKGRVIDDQSGAGLAGATIILIDSVHPMGTFSDSEGYFHLENVPVGRRAIEVRYEGYDSQFLSNLMLNSGKELEIEVRLQEKITVLSDVVITDEQDKHSVNNTIATVSSRTISIEEAGRYSGSFQDPARMAQNFAGVSGASDDRNDIIIRGNSPTGVLWRLEGIDIPSPNHFSTLGTTGGPVSMLNINNLSNSDFMTSAFTAEYGNALSGVFDLKLRNGNSDKREYLAQIGFNGFEFGTEGPIKKGTKASYLANYRYSMLAVVNALGLEFGTGSAVPYYQDLTFKVHLPTTKAGVFNFFGMGGTSNITFLGEEAGDNNLYADIDHNARFYSKTGVVGLSHTLFLDSRTYSKCVIAVSASQNGGKIDSILGDRTGVKREFGVKNQQIKYSLNYKLNRKFNAKNTASIGLIADLYQIAVFDSNLVNGLLIPTRSFEGNAVLLQSYAQWQHRFNAKLTLHTGLHSQHFLLSEAHAIEPRAGLRYQLANRHTLNWGAGLHSQIQPLPVYFVEEALPNGEVNLPNQSLDFSKSAHIVLGYEWMARPDFRIKSEIYAQRLFNIPAHTYASSFSMVNAGRDFSVPSETDLVNNGTGYNYGFELTLEKFYTKGYYFLFTQSLFQSRYEGSDGIERNTAFNGNYVVNGLGGKEFKLGNRSTLSFDTKITTAGGSRYTPIDLVASRAAGMEVRDPSKAFTEQYPAYFRADFKTTYRRNFNKFALQYSLDLQNITNHQNIFIYGFNARTGEPSTVYQRGFFPDVQFKLFF